MLLSGSVRLPFDNEQIHKRLKNKTLYNNALKQKQVLA